MSGLNGKTALVTGGVGGIGTAICKRLADAGCKVVANYIDEAHAKEWQAKMKSDGYDIAIVKCDVSSFDDCKAMGDKLTADFGGIDILVNNAGITKDGLLMRMSDDDWDTVIDTNLAGAFRCARRASKGMIRLRRGRIILISSVVGLYGGPGQANYAASKAGLVGLARSITRELGGRGITANVVAPGFIETDMTAALPEETQKAYKAAIPAGRFATPDEVAATVRFLASPDAAYISGAVIPVDGGLGMGH